jgi:hypothetical protein
MRTALGISSWIDAGVYPVLAQAREQLLPCEQARLSRQRRRTQLDL